MGSTSLRNDENSSEMSFVFNLMHTGSSTSSRAPCIRLQRNLPNIISFYFLSQGSHWINNQLSFCPSTRMSLYIVPFKKYYTITSFVTISINNFSAVKCPDIYIMWKPYCSILLTNYNFCSSTTVAAFKLSCKAFQAYLTTHLHQYLNIVKDPTIYLFLAHLVFGKISKKFYTSLR